MPPPIFASISPSTSGASLEQGAQQLRLVLDYFTAVNAATVFEAFLYGIHCILFAICCFILAKKRHITSMIFLAAAIIMFGLSTVDFSLSLRTQLIDIPKLVQGKMGLNTVVAHSVPKGQLFVANNLVADLLLLYRCFMAWNFRKSIIALSVLLILGDTAWGWVGGGTSQAFFSGSWQKYTLGYAWSIFGVNIIMTMLVVGRIWWIARRARSHLTSRDLRPYHIAIAVFAETALIYSACVLVLILLPRPNPYNSLATVTCIRLVSVMPTLLIVQIAGSRPLDDRFKKSASESYEHPSPTRAGSGMLDTMIMTRASGREDEAQEATPEGERPNVAGPSV